MHRFRRSGLKLPIHAPFGEFWGIFRHMTSPVVVTPKRTFIGRKLVVWAIQRKNQRDGSTWARAREKIQYNKNVTKVLCFPYLGGSPHFRVGHGSILLNPIQPNPLDDWPNPNESTMTMCILAHIPFNPLCPQWEGWKISSWYFLFVN